MRAVGVQRGAVAAQAIGHPQAAAFELLEAGLPNGIQGAAAVGLAHHRLQAQQAGIEVTAKLVGHHHGRAALGIDVVVLAVPEERVEVPPRLRQPTAEFLLLGGGVEASAQLQLLGDRQGRFQCGNPEGAAVGADALQRPVIKGLIRCTAVVGQAVVVDVEGLQVPQCFHGRRPALRQEAQVLAIGGELEGAPDLQDVIARQVLPEVAVLVGRVVRGIPRALVGGPQVVGCGALHLAGGFDAALALGEVPTNRPRRGVGRGDRPGKAAQDRLVELRPELQQRQGAVEPHVQALVPGVVQALQDPEAAHGVFAAGGTPEAAAAAEVIELVEERHPQRLRQIAALQHRLLPGLDLRFPLAPVVQALCGNGGGVLAAGPKEIGVAAQGARAGGEGRDR